MNYRNRTRKHKKRPGGGEDQRSQAAGVNGPAVGVERKGMLDP